jgi:hypothetical protein
LPQNRNGVFGNKDRKAAPDILLRGANKMTSMHPNNRSFIVIRSWETNTETADRIRERKFPFSSYCQRDFKLMKRALLLFIHFGHRLAANVPDLTVLVF